MASRRPSSRPSPRRRASSSDGARSTREINAEKSRQRRAAAQAAKKDEASARGKKKATKADRKKAGRTQSDSAKATASSARERLAARTRERNAKRTPRENGNILSIGGLDVSTRLVVVIVVAAILSVMLVPSLFQWWQQERELVQIKSQVAEQQKKNADMQRQLDLWNDPDYISTRHANAWDTCVRVKLNTRWLIRGRNIRTPPWQLRRRPPDPHAPGCSRSLS